MEETVEALYLLGEQDRIVKVSCYAVGPPQAHRECRAFQRLCRPMDASKPTTHPEDPQPRTRWENHRKRAEKLSWSTRHVAGGRDRTMR